MATLLLPKATPTPPPSVDLTTASASAPPFSSEQTSHTGLAMDIPSAVNIPNKHLAEPNPDGIKFTTPVTPPASPPDGTKMSKSLCMKSLLYPPNSYKCLATAPPIYGIEVSGVAAALHFIARQPMPDIDQVFPWAHGLHEDNAVQLSFFFARKKAARDPPVTFRGICVVKVGQDYGKSILKGAIRPEEILPNCPHTEGFLPVDPRDGFGVRNFHIQVGKFALLSDIIVYGDDEADREDVMKAAKRISAAQLYTRSLYETAGVANFPQYHTFVVNDPFSKFEDLFPELVTVDSAGMLTGKVVDFCHWERMEMISMSRALKEIHHNVYLGCSTDLRYKSDKKINFGVYIEASDGAQMPTPDMLEDQLLAMGQSNNVQFLEFPGSGTMTAHHRSRAEVTRIIEVCRFIWAAAHGQCGDEEGLDSDGDQLMVDTTRAPRNILLHCADGYTETTLLALAYFMYAEMVPVHEAWIKLHKERERNFFAYEKDLAFLRYIERPILEAAAHDRQQMFDFGTLSPPDWLFRMDGSLPSRILSYMYLGNLLHANNHGLLTAMGIKRVLSIGEELSWTDEEREAFGHDNVMTLRDLQDNGCDPLQFLFWRCLDFIEEGRRRGEPVLVHCRVGVSRSATICIAEVMRYMKLSLPRAYCYVRARRLNVIIQPHLRFMYELLKFEETLSTKNHRAAKRELEWIHVAREIAILNRPYTR